MTVKDREGRHRYIAFRVEARRSLSRADVIQALRGASASVPDADRPFVVLWAAGRGLVRVPHTAKDATIALLRGITVVAGVTVRVETLGTSGTIRRARMKYLETRAAAPPVSPDSREPPH